MLKEPSCHGLCSLVWAAPRHLTLPLWADFLEGCQGREKSPRLICASTTTAEAEACHLGTNTFTISRTGSLAHRMCVCVCVCLEIRKTNNTTIGQDPEVRWVTSGDLRRAVGSGGFDSRTKPSPAPGGRELDFGLLETGYQELDMVSTFCQGVLREIWV